MSVYLLVAVIAAIIGVAVIKRIKQNKNKSS